MKMIWAVIRPEFAQRVVGALDHAGIGAMTRLHITGSERDNPLSGHMSTGKSREMLMIAVPDSEVAKTVMVIRSHARPEEPGRNDADQTSGGKIFVTSIDESFTIRTAGKTNTGS
jgi:nitrogen regulatory protein PII